MNPAIRIPTAFVVAAIVTAGVLFLMQLLIATGERALSDDSVRYVLDFVRVKPDEPVTPREPRVKKPEASQQMPPSPPRPRTDEFDAGRGLVIEIPGPTRDAVRPKPTTGLAVADGEYLPIVKVAPEYPRQAIDREITGYVIVEYTVTQLGTVVDPRVVESEPAGVFEAAALRSVLKYRYKPRVVDGEAVAVSGVRTIIRFELEK